VAHLISSSLITELRALIEQSRTRVKRDVDSEMVLLYWHVGSRIRSEVLQNERAGYGQRVIEYVAQELSSQYGQGFGKRNVASMVRFAEMVQDVEILQTLSATLSWSHVIELLPIKDALERDFYLEMVRLENWSVRTMRDRMKTLLYQRTALSRKPELTIKHDLEQIRQTGQISTDFLFRDPYVLDFLELNDTYSEKDLENAILRELERFLLELGSGFTFVARQKRITVGGEDFYLDLVLFHRGLRRLVVIDLKLEHFQPSFKGQMEFYLRYLDKHERQEGEETPIGLILCSSANSEQIELLDLERDNIRVAEYLTKLPPLEVLRERLHRVIAWARERTLPQAEGSITAVEGKKLTGKTARRKRD
jgi:predicted nuclease of restriction endonuclease-like (RecB) superfamily